MSENKGNGTGNYYCYYLNGGKVFQLYHDKPCQQLDDARCFAAGAMQIKNASKCALVSLKGKPPRTLRTVKSEKLAKKGIKLFDVVVMQPV